MLKHSITTIVVNPYYTLIVAVFVIMLGHGITNKISFCKKYNIPEPVTGGLMISSLLFIVYLYYGFEFEFNNDLKNFCMLSFYASLGLSADFKSLVKGGKPLIVFVLCSTVLILCQDILGIVCTFFFESLKPLHGLVLGSIPLVGGHSTSSSWGEWFEYHHHLTGAITISIAASTYGLVAGGLVGGPVANYLMKRVPKPSHAEIIKREEENFIVFESQDKARVITSSSMIEILAMFAVCLSVSYFLTDYFNTNFPNSQFKIPPFVWALLTGTILRNILTYGFKHEIFDRNIDVFGNVTLYLFLAIVLVSVKLWQLSGLGTVIMLILGIQTLLMILYAYFVTFRVMGKNYDAVIMCAGQCGFGLGAMPTAIANMQTLTDKYGPSPKAFLIIPLALVFFLEIIHIIILTLFQYILV